MIEPVFGDTKLNRKIDRFQRRGRAACHSEWRLITATHNLLKVWRDHGAPTRLNGRRPTGACAKAPATTRRSPPTTRRPTFAQQRPWIRAVGASLLPFRGCRSGTGGD
jgi:hypothetical protein